MVSMKTIERIFWILSRDVLVPQKLLFLEEKFSNWQGNRILRFFNPISIYSLKIVYLR